MGCLSCHAMHQPADDPRVLRDWANDQLKPGMAGDEGCLQCHALPDIAVHTHHPPESSGSRCYNCHAPYTTYGLLKAIRTHLNTNPSVVTTLTTGRPNACNLCHLDKSLGWTADHLAQRYGAERPRLTEDQERIASSILHLLSGDARQRALIAWNMGWEPARHTSGSKWLSSFLAQLLEDPYDVVRYDAYHSLRKLPEFVTSSTISLVHPISEKPCDSASMRSGCDFPNQTAPEMRWFFLIHPAIAKETCLTACCEPETTER